MLDRLFNKYGCDKSSKHKYHLVYEPDFERYREEEIKILELGIFYGHSVSAWLEYFSSAQVYGIDIFTRLNPEDVDVLNNDRVKWIKGDSLSDTITETIKEEWGDIKFDIIIDDGKHTPNANRLSFRHLNQFLKDDGAYYIEDVWPLDEMTEKEMNHQWIKRHLDDYSTEEMTKFLKEIEGWDVTRFDLRKQAEPDSYIMRLKRK